MRDRASGGVGFILPDNPERLFPPVVAFDRDQRAEADLGNSNGGRDDPGGRPSSGPIAEVSPGGGERLAITRRPGLGIGFAGRRQRSLYLRQTSLGDIVAVLRDRPLRQILEVIGVVLFDESS